MADRKSLKDASRRVAKMDSAVGDALEPRRDSPALSVLEWIGGVGDQPEMRLLSAGLIGAGLATRNARMARAGTRMLLAHELATAAKDVIKRNIDRTRPRSATSITDKKARRGTRTAKEKTSFPSGHSAGAMAVARAFGREYPEHHAAATAAAALLAGAQVPRAAHYASDVAAGIALGAAAEAALAALWPAPDEAAASSPRSPDAGRAAGAWAG